MKKIAAMLVMMLFLCCSTVSAVFADESFPDGNYSIEVTSNSAMFKVVDAKLSVVNGEMSAVITLSGTGYTKLFMGTEVEAAAANEGDLINYVPDEAGKYTFAIPVAALDQEINVAAYASKSESWFGRTLTFNSNTLAPIEEEKVDEPSQPSTEPKVEEQNVVEEKAAAQEESIPKTGDNNYLLFSSAVLLMCLGIIAKNKKVSRHEK